MLLVPNLRSFDSNLRRRTFTDNLRNRAFTGRPFPFITLLPPLILATPRVHHGILTQFPPPSLSPPLPKSGPYSPPPPYLSGPSALLNKSLLTFRSLVSSNPTKKHINHNLPSIFAFKSPILKIISLQWRSGSLNGGQRPHFWPLKCQIWVFGPLIGQILALTSLIGISNFRFLVRVCRCCIWGWR